jgi:SAM-dependent methyltransferase
MPEQQAGSPNAAQAEFWNSPGSRAWADHHEPIDRLFAGLTQAALGIAAPRPGEHVLDIGCGSGTTVLELAARVGPEGYVLGADISERSVAKAQERIAAAGLRHAGVTLADVSTQAFAPGSFDLAFSRFGVMFFSEPTATFTNVHRAMKPGARLALAVFRAAGENPWTVGPLGAVRHLVPAFTPPAPGEPGMFSWAEPDRVHQILEGAGFRSISLVPLDPVMRYTVPGGAAEAAELATMVGQVFRAVADASVQQREAVRSALVTFFQDHDGPEGVILPAALWVVQARA